MTFGYDKVPVDTLDERTTTMVTPTPTPTETSHRDERLPAE